MSIRVLIADDHAQFRGLVADTLEAAGFVVCAQAATSESAVELAHEHEPDVALLDIRMPGDGIAAARRIARELGTIRVLMLTVSTDRDDVLDALQAGAHGYVLKESDPEALVDAVRTVYEGSGVIAPAVAPTVVDEVRKARLRHIRNVRGESVQLSEREADVLARLERGQSTTSIGKALFVAPVTVRSHVATLLKKLEVRTRAEAVALYREQRPGVSDEGEQAPER